MSGKACLRGDRQQVEHSVKTGRWGHATNSRKFLTWFWKYAHHHWMHWVKTTRCYIILEIGDSCGHTSCHSCSRGWENRNTRAQDNITKPRSKQSLYLNFNLKRSILYNSIHKNYGAMSLSIPQHGKYSIPSPSLYWIYQCTHLSSLLGIMLSEGKDCKVFFKKF